MTPVLHLVGEILTGPRESRREIWVIDGRVSHTAPTGAADVATIRGWVLPGFVDAHCHVGLDRNGAVDRDVTRVQAETDRDAGSLLIRDAGQPGDTRWIDDEPDLPRIVRAGRHIARPKQYQRNYGHEIEPAQLTAYVRAEARRGDGWVKLVGDWIDREAGDLVPLWPREALVEAVAAAHEEGARVTAHCFGEDCLPDLVAAGIDCIEHATGLDGSTIDSVARHGIAVVPTLVNIATFPGIADSAHPKFPRYAAHLRDLHARRYATVAAAHDAGIPVYAGTDAGGTLPHGLLGEEALELATAGLDPLAVLDAVTWGARRWLGHPGLDEGAPADLVVLDADPRVELAALTAPAAVVLRGIRRR